jgi:hypothetical protein
VISKMTVRSYVWLETSNALGGGFARCARLFGLANGLVGEVTGLMQSMRLIARMEMAPHMQRGAWL